MEHFGNELEKRREANLRGLRAFGVVETSRSHGPGLVCRTIREGGKYTVFTVGYEKRSGEELISLLCDLGIKVLADIREKPISRVADFRASALRALCEQAGIRYELWSELGSTEKQREQLKATGDVKTFESHFRTYVLRYHGEVLDRLAVTARQDSVALLCYERHHEDCHRSVVADLVADRLHCSVVAI